MAKTKKHKRGNKKGSPSETSPEMLAAEGLESLESDNFIKAIDIFKQLLKREPCRQWQEELAKAYMGRARALSAKGMPKEALAILDNLAHFCPEAPPDEVLLPFRVELLIGAGLLEKAAALFSHEAAQLKGTEAGGTLGELFAALILAGEGAILNVLPEEAPLVAHAPFASEALRAYCRKEDERATQQLKQIPSRSPYRHFVLALKGLLAMPSDLAAAARLYAKIPRTSPFYALVRPFVSCAEADKPLVNALRDMSRADLYLLATARGFDEKRLACLIGLAKAQSQPQKQIALLCSQGKEIDAEWARQACRDLLPLHPQEDRIYVNAFGHLSKLETCRLQALAFEHHHDLDRAQDCWRMSIEHLAGVPETAEKSLSIALIYRHMAEMAQRLDFGFDDGIEGEYADYLGKSLTYDPVDKPTYLKLFDCCRNDKKAMRQWLDPALEHFPRDIDILLMAAEVALDTSAFKKTSRYAEKILELDPINTRVRGLLLRAHLSHGRKLAKAGKFEPAFREFILAEEAQRSQNHRGTARTCQGLLKLLAKEEALGQALTEEGRQLVGLPCKAWLITAVEADLMGLPPGQQRKIVQQLKACNKADLNKIEFFDLLEQIKTYQIQAPHAMRKVAGLLLPLLKKSADLGFSQEESRTLCDYFYRERRFDLLQPFAAAAENHWPDRPVFTFYRLYAKAGGGSPNLNNIDRKILDRAKAEAMRQNDVYVTELIEDFIDSFPFAPPFNKGGHPDFDPRRIIDAIFGSLDEDDWDEPVPFKKPESKKAKKTKTKEKDNPLEQLELF